MTLARFGAFLRGLFLLLCLAFFLVGCTGGKPATSPVVQNVETPADSLKAIFSLTIYSPDGKLQDLDAVLFSVPGKRYRMELTGSLGIGAGYMVGLLNDPSLPLVHIHQVAGLFEGRVIPEGLEEISVRDSVISDSSVVKIHEARDVLTRHYTYAEKDGKILWLETLGRDGKTETLNIEEYKEFTGIKTPSKISFVRESERFLELRVKRVSRGKSFGSGTWRLNIPRTYQRIGE